MKLFVFLPIVLCGLFFITSTSSRAHKLDCDTLLGCNYYPGADISKLVRCELDGKTSTIRFPGNKKCGNWEQYIDYKESNKINECCIDASDDLDEEVEDPESLIVGGTSITHDKYPFIVSLGADGGCGGSILRKSSPAMILTAAHCYQAFTDIVKLGANKLGETTQQNSNVIDSKIKSYRIHPDYNEKNEIDIAVLWLETDISSLSQFKEIDSIKSVSSGSECCTAGDDLQVIGYGGDSDGNATPTLEFVDVDYVKRSDCFLSEAAGQLCARTEDINIERDACRGDSGGPLIKKGTMEQVGVVSQGALCGQNPDRQPGVYADVGLYKQWIDEQKALTTAPSIVSGTISIMADNKCDYSISQNGGNSYTLWKSLENPVTLTDGTNDITAFQASLLLIVKISSNTVLKFKCSDTDNNGGLMATVTYNGNKYSTKQGGNFKLSDDTTTGLIYKDRNTAPWNTFIANERFIDYDIESDAKFIWNSSNKNELTFLFKFSNILGNAPNPTTSTTPSPLSPPSPPPTQSQSNEQDFEHCDINNPMDCGWENKSECNDNRCCWDNNNNYCYY